MPSNVGEIYPCNTIPFRARGIDIVPAGYDFAKKYEWFVNGANVKTSTTPSDFGLDWILVGDPTAVYVKVYYYNASSGTYSGAYTSGTFNTLIKSLNFNGIVKTSGDLNFGCTGSVSFNVGVGSCSLCYTPLSYSISWSTPSGWTQTAISTNGNDVTFTPSSTTGGTLIATITLPCGYSIQKTYNIIRTSTAPTFTAANFSGCSSATASINSTCGASDYTYTIVGSAGATFTSSGTQSLTTASTSAAISYSGAGEVAVVKVKANYPGSVSSTEVTADLILGSPQPTNLTFPLIDPTFWKIQGLVDPIPGATYAWYRNGTQITYPPYTGNFIQFPIPHVCDVEYDISVTLTNGCGTSGAAHANAYVPCESFMIIAPNPASDEVTVSMDETKMSTSSTGIEQVKLYDLQGNLKKVWKFNKMRSARIHVGTFPSGNYYLEIIAGKTSERKMLLIKK